MALTGRCPKCQALVGHIVLENPKIREGSQSTFLGVTYLCPHCRTILGAVIDPVALKTDVVNDVVKKMKGSWPS